jgi:hypothetical protein
MKTSRIALLTLVVAALAAVGYSASGANAPAKASAENCDSGCGTCCPVCCSK